ncbi:hypothetical protein [Jiulongibacter sediminis]|jgi:hypothetical protein|uniref:hypothetical protein n=1 Tax=Jiulongibacter sediminis TaxID=1605367 RepID=UPI0026EB5217|nr:hypothetical protein [Jiulongibacter sediminis]
MKKDIKIPEVTDVYLAIIKEYNEVFQCEDWNAYLINDKDESLEMVIIVSHGYDEKDKTSLMRKRIDKLPAKSFAKIELIQPELFKLNNEFNITFFEGNRMMEKTFIVPQNSISENALDHVPMIEKMGVLASSL